MLHTTNKACPMMSGGNTDSRQNTCMKPDTLPLHSSFEHVSKALFGPKFFFLQLLKTDTQIFCVLCCLCWKRNNYKHCTKLGLFVASIQLEFISTTELQNTIIL
jgi:hypothetical protein